MSQYIIFLCILVYCMHMPVEGTVIDISNEDTLLPTCYIFEYHYDNVPTRMIIPKDDVTVKSVRDGDSITLWEGRDDESCAMIVISLKDGKPMIASISKFGPERSTVNIYKVGELWNIDYSDNGEKFDNEFSKLRITPTSLSEFVMYIPRDEEHEMFVTAKFNLIGVPTRIDVPKQGNNAVEVKYRDQPLWNRSKDGEHCIATISHAKNGYPYLLYILVKNDILDTLDVHYYEMVEHTWVKVTDRYIREKIENLFAFVESDTELSTSHDEDSNDDDTSQEGDFTVEE